MKRNEQKLEALARMKMLKLHENAIREFEEQDLINLSERGILYWLDEKQQKLVKNFENDHDAVVYHVIHDYTEFGELLSYLYVSKHKSEWKQDRNDINHGTALVYVENLDDSWCSEFGSIGIQPRFGGVIRTA